MTDTEIAIAALTDWPVEARPKRVIACDHILTTGQYLTVFGRDNEDDLAIALFVAAGIMWLQSQRQEVRIDPDDSVWLRHMHNDGSFVFIKSGPTLLSAIDASIRSAKGDKHE